MLSRKYGSVRAVAVDCGQAVHRADHAGAVADEDVSSVGREGGPPGGVLGRGRVGRRLRQGEAGVFEAVGGGCGDGGFVAGAALAGGGFVQDCGEVAVDVFGGAQDLRDVVGQLLLCSCPVLRVQFRWRIACVDADDCAVGGDRESALAGQLVGVLDRGLYREDRVGGLSDGFADRGDSGDVGVQALHVGLVLGGRAFGGGAAPAVHREKLAVVVALADQNLHFRPHGRANLVQHVRVPGAHIGQRHHQRGPRIVGAAGNTPAAAWSPRAYRSAAAPRFSPNRWACPHH